MHRGFVSSPPLKNVSRIFHAVPSAAVAKRLMTSSALSVCASAPQVSSNIATPYSSALLTAGVSMLSSPSGSSAPKRIITFCIPAFAASSTQSAIGSGAVEEHIGSG